MSMDIVIEKKYTAEEIHDGLQEVRRHENDGASIEILNAAILYIERAESRIKELSEE